MTAHPVASQSLIGANRFWERNASGERANLAIRDDEVNVMEPFPPSEEMVRKDALTARVGSILTLRVDMF